MNLIDSINQNFNLISQDPKIFFINVADYIKFINDNTITKEILNKKIKESRNAYNNLTNKQNKINNTTNKIIKKLQTIITNNSNSLNFITTNTEYSELLFPPAREFTPSIINTKYNYETIKEIIFKIGKSPYSKLVNKFFLNQKHNRKKQEKKFKYEDTFRNYLTTKNNYETESITKLWASLNNLINIYLIIYESKKLEKLIDKTYLTNQYVEYKLMSNEIKCLISGKIDYSDSYNIDEIYSDVHRLHLHIIDQLINNDTYQNLICEQNDNNGKTTIHISKKYGIYKEIFNRKFIYPIKNNCKKIVLLLNKNPISSTELNSKIQYKSGISSINKAIKKINKRFIKYLNVRHNLINKKKGHGYVLNYVKYEIIKK